MKLQQFNIVNSKLDSINLWAINELYHGEKQKSDAMLLELNLVNDSIEFIYSFHNTKQDYINKFICIGNKRILGYTKQNKIDIILLSNIDNLYEMVYLLSPFIKPTKHYKTFEYLNHTNDQFNNWYSYPDYNYLEWHFKYYNGEIMFQFFKRYSS